MREHYSEVVAVNDCSTDDSAAQIQAGGAYLVNHPINMGQGAALQTGMSSCGRSPASATSSPLTPTVSIASKTSPPCWR
ncbi:hypothetical protein [Propioniciclava flava]